MFRGTSFHTLDDKGRIIIPTRYREIVRATSFDGIVVSRLDDCLVAYSMPGWEKIEKQILDLAETDDNMRLFRRVFIGGAEECPCDKQGRVLIPPSLRKYGSLERDIAMVGVLDHFEIWERSRWDQQTADFEDNMKQQEALKTQIAKLGL